MTNVFAEYPSKVVDRFTRWHSQNPNIFERFKELARKIRSTGKKKYGARCIVEKIRYDLDERTVGEDVFEINSDYVPMLARLLIDEDPTFETFFSLRVVRSRGIQSQEQIDREEIRRQEA
jgi:hypothetical protein